MTGSSLTPAAELVKKASFRYPNESREYRDARNALLVEEIELRRQIERVVEVVIDVTFGRTPAHEGPVAVKEIPAVRRQMNHQLRLRRVGEFESAAEIANLIVRGRRQAGGRHGVRAFRGPDPRGTLDEGRG